MVPDRPRGPSPTGGFALVLALLFTGMVLVIVVATAATVVTGTRRGGADERAAYHAQLVAESGLSTLPRRAAEYVRTHPYAGTTPAALQTWLDGLRAAVNADVAADGTTLALRAVSAATFTAVSTGETPTARRTVAQDYSLTPRHLPAGLRPHAAVTSRPRVVAGGHASVTPAGRGTVGTLAAVTVGPQPTTVPLALPAGVRAGDYVVVGGSTLRLDAVGSATATVTRVRPPTGTATVGGDVTLLPNAAAATVSAVTSTVTVRVSNATDFAAGETVTVGDGAAARATVQGVDAAAGTVTLAWTDAATRPADIPEGSPVARDVLAMASAGEVTVDPSAEGKLDRFQGVRGGTVTNDCTSMTTCAGSEDPAVDAAATRSAFTRALLGVSDEQLNDLVPVTPAPAAPLATLTDVGLLRIRAADYPRFFAPNRRYAGTVIVDDVMTANASGVTLDGFLYFRDGMTGKFTGSMVVNGGMAVYGSATDTTSVLSGNVTVTFDPVALRLALAGAAGNLAVTPVEGTWRQR